MAGKSNKTIQNSWVESSDFFMVKELSIYPTILQDKINQLNFIKKSANQMEGLSILTLAKLWVVKPIKIEKKPANQMKGLSNSTFKSSWVKVLVIFL